MGKHITIFDRAYPREKQVEGLAISEAVASGKCDKCAHFRVTWNGCTPDFECPISDRCLNRDMWEWNGGEKEE